MPPLFNLRDFRTNINTDELLASFPEMFFLGAATLQSFTYPSDSDRLSFKKVNRFKKNYILQNCTDSLAGMNVRKNNKMDRIEINEKQSRHPV